MLRIWHPIILGSVIGDTCGPSNVQAPAPAEGPDLAPAVAVRRADPVAADVSKKNNNPPESAIPGGIFLLFSGLLMSCPGPGYAAFAAMRGSRNAITFHDFILSSENGNFVLHS